MTGMAGREHAGARVFICLFSLSFLNQLQCVRRDGEAGVVRIEVEERCTFSAWPCYDKEEKEMVINGRR